MIRDIRLGIKNLLLHGLRSLLTMTGMIFGVGSVIAMLAVGEGAGRQALEQIRTLGSQNIIIEAMKPLAEASASRGRVNMSIYGLRYDDDARILETFPAVVRTVPVKIVRREGRSGSRSLELRVIGTTPDWFRLVKRPQLGGRLLLDRDLEKKAGVVVLTEYSARQLLAMGGGIGQTIRIGSSYFEVVGIVKSESGKRGDIDTLDQPIDAYVPITTLRERLGDIMVEQRAGSRTRERVELHRILAEVATPEEVSATASGIEEMLRRFHPQSDYRVQVPLALLRQAASTKRTFNIVLGAIAGISLLVGGIGIMNIMLASVTERTREIGIRRAIGAKRGQIVGQFLIETAVLSGAGGLIGTALGITLPWVITHFTRLPTAVTLTSLVLALSISLVTGIVFGLYPAFRAARLNPIEALRHE